MRNQHSFPFTVLLQVLLPSLKCGLRALEPPSCSHQLAIAPLISTSEFPGDLQPSPDPHLSVLITKLKPHGFGQPPVSLQEYPLCPKHSICITMLGHPQTLSGSPFPFSSPKHNPREPGTSPRDFLCPYAQSTILKAWNPPQPSSCFGPHCPASCSGCGPLSLPLLVGLVATDAVVSLLIVAVVFVCARLRSRPTQGEGRKGPGWKGVVSLGRRSPWRGPLGKP